MRLAVFTNKYPARVATFFERDLRALIAAGVHVEVFPIYPLDPGLWRYSLDLLGEDVLPRDRVHHVDLRGALARGNGSRPRRAGTLLRDAVAVSAAALPYGPMALAKSLYVLPKAWAWAGQFAGRFDHILAYWGNYTATCAYAFHRLTNPDVPFSIWLHAGTDLYRQPVFLRQKLAWADRIITCCDFNRRYLAEHFPESSGDKVHVSYHGLDLAGFPFSTNGRPAQRVIAVGRFASEKGFDDLLRAVGLLAQRGTAPEVELVGDGPQAPQLRALADRLGIADRVRFRGWLPFRDVHAAMRAATILVHPSPGLGDGLPNVIREAMALGTPVIATRVAGIPEALDDGRCGVLVPPRAVDTLAEAIAQLLADAPRRRRLAELARRRTEDLFDLWANGARLATVLRNTPSRDPRMGGARAAAAIL